MVNDDNETNVPGEPPDESGNPGFVLPEAHRRLITEVLYRSLSAKRVERDDYVKRVLQGGHDDGPFEEVGENESDDSEPCLDPGPSDG